MRNPPRIIAVLASLLALLSGGLGEAMAQKSASAPLVKYRVEGVHKARASVVHGDRDSRADVTDRITVEFSWDTKKDKVVGPVTVSDAKTEFGNIRSEGTNCPPPQLMGDYEHFQSVSNSVVSDNQIQINGARTYPPARAPNYPASCSLRAVPGKKVEVLLWVAAAGPEVLGMPNVPGGPVTISADRKSFSLKGADNWVWTYTPSPR